MRDERGQKSDVFFLVHFADPACVYRPVSMPSSLGEEALLGLETGAHAGKAANSHRLISTRALARDQPVHTHTPHVNNHYFSFPSLFITIRSSCTGSNKIKMCPCLSLSHISLQLLNIVVRSLGQQEREKREREMVRVARAAALFATHCLWRCCWSLEQNQQHHDVYVIRSAADALVVGQAASAEGAVVHASLIGSVVFSAPIKVRP